MLWSFHHRKSVVINLVFLVFVLVYCGTAFADGTGFITARDGRRLFPIGFYELPENDADLMRMVDSGVNLIRCKNKTELDRVAKAGIMGVMSLDLSQGETDALRKQIQSVTDHPALAVWEGPDEIVWRFTGWSGLWRKDAQGIFQHDGEWWMQTPEVVRYSEGKANEIIPKLIEGIQLIRTLDHNNRQIWLNEARNSDVKFCRQYMDYIDITGCDYYPIRGDIRDAIKLGKTTERWIQTGRGKPVWMVLQAFSWSEMGKPGTFYYYPEAYPSFDESRLMAYVSIVYGAKGILYWGSSQNKTPPDFRRSLYALTAELSALQPFLTASEEDMETVNLIECMTAGRIEGWFRENEGWPPPHKLGVRSSLRKAGSDWLLVLVNEDNSPHYGVEVAGLDMLNGSKLYELYGDEEQTVGHSDFVTRMKPFEVKLFSTGTKWETDRIEGRNYQGIAAK